MLWMHKKPLLIQYLSLDHKINSFSDVPGMLRMQYKKRLERLFPIPWLEEIQLSLADVYVSPNLRIKEKDR